MEPTADLDTQKLDIESIRASMKPVKIGGTTSQFCLSVDVS